MFILIEIMTTRRKRKRGRKRKTEESEFNEEFNEREKDISFLGRELQKKKCMN